jgi:hypothetical protein
MDTRHGETKGEIKGPPGGVSSAGTAVPSMIRAVSSPVSNRERQARQAATSPTPLAPLLPTVPREMPFVPPITRQLSKDPYHTYLSELLSMGIPLATVSHLISFEVDVLPFAQSRCCR